MPKINKIIQKKIINILKTKEYNWKEKAHFILSIIDTNENGNEILQNIIEKHKKAIIRKEAASVLGYLNKPEIAIKLIHRIFEEPDWTVRFALSNSCGKNLELEAIKQIQVTYKNKLAETEINEHLQLRKSFAESIGHLGFVEGQPLLQELLKETEMSREPQNDELIIQILYSLGEVGDKTVVDLLLKYSADNPKNTDSVRQSANHAIDKIAKRFGFVSKKGLLDAINENQI
ncbi:MAG: HEAT repeat domain-containing protein [Asgard group archaeon]|nr:HEAT repeat domain-containing protein [Asgard group archaeon]